MKKKLDKIKQGKTIMTCHDENCPKCNFPETLIVRSVYTMKPLRIKCSNYRKCDWEQNI